MHRHIICLLVLGVAGMMPRAYGINDEQLHELGLLSVKEFGAIPDDAIDDTAAIQSAIDAAKSQAKVCLFPAGTYLVSETLRCYKPNMGGQVDGQWDFSGDREGGHRYNNFNLIGSTRNGVRPVIKLNDNCNTAFDRELGSVTIATEARKAKPVIHFSTFADENSDGKWDFIDQNGNGVWDDPSEGSSKMNRMSTDGPGEQAWGSDTFFHTIRNVDFDLNAKSSAVAIMTQGAQSNFIEDIAVEAEGAWGGFHGYMGSRSTNGNLKVNGGRVGIYGSAQHTTSIAGVRLINQTDYAFYHTSTSAMLVGFEIVKNAPPAVGLDGTGAFWSDIALVDGTIDFSSAGDAPAIQNDNEQGLYMRNVFVSGAHAVVKSGKRAEVKTVGDVEADQCTRVVEYSNPDGASGQNLIDGKIDSEEYQTLEAFPKKDIPDDLIARHLWNEEDFPSPDDLYDRVHTDGDTTIAIATEHGVVADDTDPNVSGDSDGTDTRAALQTLIDSGKKIILLPKGKYLIGKNPAGDFGIELGAHTTLVGVSPNLSELRSIDSWDPTTESFLLITKNDPASDAKIAFLKFGFQIAPLENSWFGGFHWQAGRHSMTRDIAMRTAGSSKIETQPRTDQMFSGNAGGKHYGLGGSGGPSGVNHKGFTRFRIKDTKGEPLLFYNPNFEDGKNNEYQFLVDSSKNVAIYGAKQEDHPPIGFRNSDNCVLICHGGNATAVSENSTRVLCAVVGARSGSKSSMEEVGVAELEKKKSLALFKRGEVDWDALHIKND